MCWNNNRFHGLLILSIVNYHCLHLWFRTNANDKVIARANIKNKRPAKGLTKKKLAFLRTSGYLLTVLIIYYYRILCYQRINNKLGFWGSAIWIFQYLLCIAMPLQWNDSNTWNIESKSYIIKLRTNENPLFQRTECLQKTMDVCIQYIFLYGVLTFFSYAFAYSFYNVHKDCTTQFVYKKMNQSTAREH